MSAVRIHQTFSVLRARGAREYSFFYPSLHLSLSFSEGRKGDPRVHARARPADTTLSVTNPRVCYP